MKFANPFATESESPPTPIQLSVPEQRHPRPESKPVDQARPPAMSPPPTKTPPPLRPSSTLPPAAIVEPRISVRNLEAGYGDHRVLKGIQMDVPPRSVTAIMGPSGCGKSTFIRCINRLHEETPGAWSRGQVILDGQDLFHPSIDPVDMRRKIGMVFQRPNPFPTFTIYENVAAGLRLNGWRRGAMVDERVE
jgi:ABC-type multidrug transport system fused ATPase/permease subunit